MDMCILLATLGIAILAFAIKEVLSIFIFKPWSSFNDLRGRIFEVLTRYSNDYINPDYFYKTKEEALKSVHEHHGNPQDHRFNPAKMDFVPTEKKKEMDKAKVEDHLKLLEKYRQISLEIRKVASETYGFVPNRYGVLCWLPSKKSICEIAESLMIISNFYDFTHEFGDQEEYKEKILMAEDKIKKLLPDNLNIIGSSRVEREEG